MDLKPSALSRGCDFGFEFAVMMISFCVVGSGSGFFKFNPSGCYIWPVARKAENNKRGGMWFVLARGRPGCGRSWGGDQSILNRLRC